MMTLVLLFGVSVLVITVSGTRIAQLAEEIAVQTGWGQALVGAVFIGISTSLSGTVLSFYAASQSYPSLATSNAIGGIAAQTVFLSIVDLTYKKGNLEHAAASLENLAQSALLLILLPIPLLIMMGPDWTLFHVHPGSILLVLAYILGLNIVRSIKSDPMWEPKFTRETQKERDLPRYSSRLFRKTMVRFFIYAFLLGMGGYMLAETAVELSLKTGLSESGIGGFLTSVTTSLPELVTAMAAVRRGALNLAVGDIIGGNCFDVLFLAGADFFFTYGSIYHEMEDSHVLLISMTILMTGVLTLGLIRREKTGPAGIGFESFIILGLYLLLGVLMFA